MQRVKCAYRLLLYKDAQIETLMEASVLLKVSVCNTITSSRQILWPLQQQNLIMNLAGQWKPSRGNRIKLRSCQHVRTFKSSLKLSCCVNGHKSLHWGDTCILCFCGSAAENTFLIGEISLQPSALLIRIIIKLNDNFKEPIYRLQSAYLCDTPGCAAALFLENWCIVHMHLYRFVDWTENWEAALICWRQGHC